MPRAIVDRPSPATRQTPLPRVSPWLLHWFARYSRGYLARHFHALRGITGSVRSLPTGQPVVVCMNHPSWWDPLIGLTLATSCFPGRRHYAAMDTEALQGYKFFERLGFFGVERGSGRGAIQFLRLGERLLAEPDSVLWITPHGRYADARERPPRLLRGLSTLLARSSTGVVLPLALEYGFWSERLPEAFAEFGEPLSISQAGLRHADWWADALTDGLAVTQDRLARRVIARDPAPFETLLAGRTGMGNIYGWWRWLRGSSPKSQPAESSSA